MPISQTMAREARNAASPSRTAGDRSARGPVGVARVTAIDVEDKRRVSP